MGDFWYFSFLPSCGFGAPGELRVGGGYETFLRCTNTLPSPGHYIISGIYTQRPSGQRGSQRQCVAALLALATTLWPHEGLNSRSVPHHQIHWRIRMIGSERRQTAQAQQIPEAQQSCAECEPRETAAYSLYAPGVMATQNALTSAFPSSGPSSILTGRYPAEIYTILHKFCYRLIQLM